MQRFLKGYIKSIAGYILFCAAMFILFFYLLFPREEIKARLIYEMEKATATEIKTSGDRWVFPLGLTLKDMEFKERGGLSGHPIAHVDKFSLGIPVKSILFFNPVTNLAADIYGGSARGLLTLRSNNRILQAQWTNVDISRIEGLKEVPAELSGKLSGDLLLRLMDNRPDGQIHLFIKDGRLRKVKVMGLTLPDLPINELQGFIDIKGDTLSLKDIRFKNSEIKGIITGDIHIHPDTKSGELNISIRFSVGEKIKKEYQGLLSVIEKSKDREGYYTIQLKGDLKKPTVG